MFKRPSTYQKTGELLNRIEPYFFYGLIFIHLLPFFRYSFFPTVDGPAHLYNSRILLEIITGEPSILHNYYTLNSGILPNWSGHFLLSFLQLFFSAQWAEKLLLMSYVIGLPLSFRYLFKQFQLRERYLLYFVFPFIYSFLFYYGFHNFNIGLVILFFGIGWWYPRISGSLNAWKIFGLFFFSMAIYFSHLFVFVVFIGAVVWMNLWVFFLSPEAHSLHRAEKTRHILAQLLSVSLPLLLTAIYITSNPIVDAQANYLSTTELWEMIIQSQPAKGVSYGREAIFTKWIFPLLITLGIAQLILYFLSNLHAERISVRIWGGLLVFSLIGLFVLPNSTTGSVGLVSSRMVLFLFLFLIVFLATRPLPFWVKIAPFILINYVNIALLNIYDETTAELNTVASEIHLAADQLEPNSVVFPINSSSNHLFAHISNYLGIEKNTVILENYEASLNHFPIKWKPNSLPHLHFGDSITQFQYPNLKESYKVIDYIFMLSDTDSSSLSNVTLLKQNYTPIFRSESGQVTLLKYQK